MLYVYSIKLCLNIVVKTGLALSITHMKWILGTRWSAGMIALLLSQGLLIPRQLRWVAHIVRMEGSCLSKAIFYSDMGLPW